MTLDLLLAPHGGRDGVCLPPDLSVRLRLPRVGLGATRPPQAPGDPSPAQHMPHAQAHPPTYTTMSMQSKMSWRRLRARRYSRRPLRINVHRCIDPTDERSTRSDTQWGDGLPVIPLFFWCVCGGGGGVHMSCGRAHDGVLCARSPTLDRTATVPHPRGNTAKVADSDGCPAPSLCLPLPGGVFFLAQTHVCLVSARSDGPDHADSLSATYESRTRKFTCRLQRWDVYLDAGFQSPEHAAVCCRHALGACMNGKEKGGGGLPSGGVESNCEKLQENCGKLRKIAKLRKIVKNCGPQLPPPPPLQRFHQSLTSL